MSLWRMLRSAILLLTLFPVAPGRGDFAGDVQAVARTGIDALFSDFPKQARETLDKRP